MTSRGIGIDRSLVGPAGAGAGVSVVSRTPNSSKHVNPPPNTADDFPPSQSKTTPDFVAEDAYSSFCYDDRPSELSVGRPSRREAQTSVKEGLDDKPVVFIYTRLIPALSLLLQCSKDSEFYCVSEENNFTILRSITDSCRSYKKCIWLCLDSVPTGQWLATIRHIMATQVEYIEADLLKIFGMRLALFGGLQKRELPLDLRKLQVMVLPELRDEVGAVYIADKMKDVCYDRVKNLESMITDKYKGNVHVVILHIKVSCEDSEEKPYHTLLEILEDNGSSARQEIQTQYKSPHGKILNRDVSTKSITFEIRPYGSVQFREFIIAITQNKIQLSWTTFIVERGSPPPNQINITYDANDVQMITTLIAKEEQQSKAANLRRMLETDSAGSVPRFGIVRNADRDPEEDMRKKINVITQCYENYLGDKTRTPAEFIKVIQKQQQGWNIIAEMRNGKDYNAIHMAIETERGDFIKMIFYLGLWGVLREQVALPSQHSPAVQRGYTPRRVAESLSFKDKGQKMLQLIDFYDGVWLNLPPLHKACVTGETSLVKAILECDPDQMKKSTARDKLNNTCLIYACASANSHLVEYIMNKFDQVDRLNKQSETCVHLISFLGHTEILEKYNKLTLNISVFTKQANNPLEQSALTGNMKELQLYKKSGYKFPPKLLAMAARNKQFKVLQYLLEDSHIADKINEGADNDGRLAIHHAVLNQDIKTLNLLLQKEADIFKVDKYGKNIFHLVAETKNTEMAQILVQKVKTKFEDFLRITINQQDYFVGRDIFYVVRGREQRRKAWNWIKIKRMLLHAFNASLQSGKLEINQFGELLASGYSASPDAEMVARMKQKTDVSLREKKPDITPLHKAVSTKCTDLVQLFLDNGANPNIPDYFKATPVHYAAMNGDFEIFKLLESYKANLELKTDEGLGPKDVALNNGHLVLVNYIESRVYLDKAKNFVENAVQPITSLLVPEVLKEKRAEGTDVRRHMITTLGSSVEWKLPLETWDIPLGTLHLDTA